MEVGSNRHALGLVAAFGVVASLSGQPQQPRERPDSHPRVLISIAARQLWVLNAAGDTLYAAPVAVGSGKTMLWRGKRWTFDTPRGDHRVLSKEKDPVWIPPQWYYVEEARERRLDVVELQRGKSFPIGMGQSLIVRRDSVGILGADSTFRPLPPSAFIVFGRTLFVPPFGTVNRRIKGTLGSYRLNLGGGFGLHGTPDHGSIPKPVTHGCVRLHDADIAWLYENVPVGSVVKVF